MGNDPSGALSSFPPCCSWDFQTYYQYITAVNYETIAFTLTCSENTLKKRHDKRGDKGETNYYWLRLPPCPGDIVIDTDNKSIREVVKEMKTQIDTMSE